MNRFFLIVTLYALPNLVFGQEYTITLENKKLQIKDFPYYVTRVTDARTQNYCIGIAKAGVGNRRVPAFSKDSLNAELMGLFTRSFGGDTAGRKPIVVRINHLFVYEATASVEQAFLEISLSFLQPASGGYLELATVGATSVKNSSLDVSRKHDDNIVAGIKECLETLYERTQRQLLSARLVAEANLYQPPPPASFSMLQGGPSKSGIYHTFSDFLNNTPNQTPGLPITLIEVPAKGKQPTRYYIEARTKQLKDLTIWGVSDGKDAYALISGDYYRIDRSGDSLLLTAPGPAGSSSDALAGAVIGGIIGGLAGGIIGGAIGGAMSEESAATRYQLDLLSSSLTPVNLPNARRVESRIVLVCSEFAKSPITVRLDGKELCTLGKGTFHRFRLPPPAREMTLTLESDGKTVQEKIKPELLNTEVCLLRTVKGGPRMDTPDGEIRQKLLKQIKSGELEERCKQ